MKSFGAATYGDRIAAIYDETYPADSNVERVASVLADLTGHADALELGIGTGRIALPLVRHGVAVSGIDSSGEMVKQMRAKPGGSAISVVIGDFANFQVEGRLGLVYVIFNRGLYTYPPTPAGRDASPYTFSGFTGQPTLPPPPAVAPSPDAIFLPNHLSRMFKAAFISAFFSTSHLPQW